MDDNDNTVEKPIQVPLEQPRLSNQLDATDRQRSIKKLNVACRLRDTTTVTLSDYETLVKNFEERVFSAALHKQDYLDRISLKIVELERGRSREANLRMPNPATGNVESRDSNRSQMPPPTTRTSSTNGEKHVVVEPWREKTYKRIVTLRRKYAPQLEKLYDNVNSELNMLISQGYNSNQSKFKKLEKLCIEMGDLLEVLNISADELERGQEMRMTSLEKSIVSYLSMFFEPPGLPQNDHPKKTHETSSSVPLLPPLVTSPGIPPSSLHEEYENFEKSLIPQPPIQRLTNAVSASSQNAFKSAVDDMHSVMFQPRPTTVNPRIEAYTYSDKLREEIEEVNQKLIDTQVNICEQEDTNLVSSGIVIECLFHSVSAAANLKPFISRYQCLSTTLVEPLRLLVPTDYPKSSPELLGECPGEIGDAFLDVSSKARSRLVRYLRECENPITVGEIAQTWEVCAREVIVELAEKYGGGTFSSKYER